MLSILSQVIEMVTYQRPGAISIFVQVVSVEARSFPKSHAINVLMQTMRMRRKRIGSHRGVHPAILISLHTSNDMLASFVMYKSGKCRNISGLRAQSMESYTELPVAQTSGPRVEYCTMVLRGPDFP